MELTLTGVCREFWKHFTHPGTFRGLARATVQWACGNGWTFTWPAHAVISDVKCQQPAEEASSERIDNWCVPARSSVMEQLFCSLEQHAMHACIVGIVSMQQVSSSALSWPDSTRA